MGSQCTPRAYHIANSDSNYPKKTQQKLQRHSSCQIILTPNFQPFSKVQRLAVKKVVSNEQNNKMQKSHVITEIQEKKLHHGDIKNEGKGKILGCIETQSTLQQAKNTNSHHSVSDGEPSAFHLNKSNITLKVQTPSQMRESLLSAWNKSNFDERQFFQTVNYDQIFAGRSISQQCQDR